jgi:hypothetical protein
MCSKRLRRERERRAGGGRERDRQEQCALEKREMKSCEEYSTAHRLDCIIRAQKTMKSVDRVEK